MSRPANQTSVSYGDVLTAADELERVHRCHIHFQWFMNNKSGQRWVWSLRIVALWKGKGSAITHERGRSMEWPSVDFKTPAAAMLNLVYSLDYDLTAEADSMTEAQLGQLRFA